MTYGGRLLRMVGWVIESMDLSGVGESGDTGSLCHSYATIGGSADLAAAGGAAAATWVVCGTMPRSGLLAATLEDSGAAVIFVVRSGFMGVIMGRRRSEVRPRRTANIENVAHERYGLRASVGRVGERRQSRLALF